MSENRLDLAFPHPIKSWWSAQSISQAILVPLIIRIIVNALSIIWPMYTLQTLPYNKCCWYYVFLCHTISAAADLCLLMSCSLLAYNLVAFLLLLVPSCFSCFLVRSNGYVYLYLSFYIYYYMSIFICHTWCLYCLWIDFEDSF